MPLVVLAYPKISDEDSSWIQSVRDEHDELNGKALGPHFTFVFPIVMEPSLLIPHVRSRVGQASAFDFTLRCATVVKDSFNEYTHVFLVPDEGHSNIVKLHDNLYTGMLEKELRLDIAYIPHVGIANSTDAQSCKKLADRLNATDFAIRGVIDALDVATYEGEHDLVKTIERITLSTK
jgi:hypothetical protein